MQEEMKKDYENEINERVYMKLSSLDVKFSDEQLDIIRNVLFMILPDYDINRTSHELTVYEGDINAQILKKFLVCKKINGCTDRTLRVYKTEIERYLEKTGKTCMDIETDDIRKLFAQEKLRGCSDTYIDNARRYLSSFFGWMEDEELIKRNPMRKIKRVKMKRKKKEALTDMEIEMLRNEAKKDERDAFLLEFLLSTGVRAMECVNVKLEEMEENRVIVHGKGKKDRYVYMNAKAQFALKEYLQTREDDNIYLFPKRKNNKNIGKNWYKNKELVDEKEHMSEETVNSIVKRLGVKAGIKSRSHAHKYRRTCATIALRNGMPIEQVSKMLGHEDVGTTQIYLDMAEKDLEIAHEKYVR